MELQIAYDIPTGAYPGILQKMGEHLRPKPQLDEAVLSVENLFLKPVRKALVTPHNPNDQLIIPSIDWTYAGYLCKALALFPSVQDLDSNLLTTRYQVPVLPGQDTSYSLEMYGQNVNGIGASPLVMRMRGDSIGQNDQLELLQSWNTIFQQRGYQGMLDSIINVGLKLKGLHDQPLPTLPQDEEGFRNAIEKVQALSALNLVNCAIGSLRFWWDFFGKPVSDQGYEMLSARVQLSPTIYVQLSTTDVDMITAYPPLTKDTILTQMLSKHPDDFRAF